MFAISAVFALTFSSSSEISSVFFCTASSSASIASLFALTASAMSAISFVMSSIFSFASSIASLISDKALVTSPLNASTFSSTSLILLVVSADTAPIFSSMPFSSSSICVNPLSMMSVTSSISSILAYIESPLSAVR